MNLFPVPHTHHQQQHGKHWPEVPASQSWLIDSQCETHTASHLHCAPRHKDPLKKIKWKYLCYCCTLLTQNQFIWPLFLYKNVWKFFFIFVLLFFSIYTQILSNQTGLSACLCGHKDKPSVCVCECWFIIRLAYTRTYTHPQLLWFVLKYSLCPMWEQTPRGKKVAFCGEPLHPRASLSWHGKYLLLWCHSRSSQSNSD